MHFLFWKMLHCSDQSLAIDLWSLLGIIWTDDAMMPWPDPARGCIRAPFKTDAAMVVVNSSGDITMNMQQLQHECATRSIDFETIIKVSLEVTIWDSAIAWPLDFLCSFDWFQNFLLAPKGNQFPFNGCYYSISWGLIEFPEWLLPTNLNVCIVNNGSRLLVMQTRLPSQMIIQ